MVHVPPTLPYEANPAMVGSEASRLIQREVFGRRQFFAPELLYAPTAPGGGTVDGSGTADFVAKWSDSDTLTDSLIQDDGDTVTINSPTNPQFVVEGGSSATQIQIDAAAAVVRDIIFSTGGVARWLIRTNATAESGSDAGSDLEIVARDDSGALLSKPLTITRATGDFLVPGEEFVISADTYLFRTNTADASDNKRIVITGGGAASTSRGAIVITYGNEYATSPGNLHLFAGATGVVRIRGDMVWDTDASWDIGADGATRPNNLYLAGAIISYPNGGSLTFQTSGVGSRWIMNSSGHLICNTDAALDIGASGANRPRSIYLSSTLNASLCDVTGGYRYGGVTVVQGRQTGWAAMTGTAARSAAAAHANQTISNPPTQAQVENIDNSLVIVAQRLKALIDDLMDHGLIGA